MAVLSISEAALWAERFLRREWPLAASLALAFLMLPTLVVQLFAPDIGDAGGKVDGALLAQALCWMIPGALVALFGGAALTALALAPGISVGEAIGLAARRFWVVVAALLIVSAGLLLGLIAFTFIGVLMGMTEWALMRLGVVAVVVAGMAAMARFMPLVPVAVMGRAGPIATLRRSWALSAGHFGRLLGASLLMFLLGTLIPSIVHAVAGVLAMLAGMAAAGSAPVAAMITTLLVAMVSAAVSACWHIFIAGIYRQLAGR